MDTKITKWVLIAGGFFSLLVVVVGAFGTHALKPVLDVKAMGWIETGIFYQAIHALALIACGLLPNSRSNARTAVLLIAGICLFSGSLYLMAITGITKLGFVTPLGGLCFIFAWISFGWMVWSLEE